MRCRLMAMAASGLTALVLAAAPAVEAQKVVGIASPSREETKWVVDMVHSQVDFGVRHLVGRVRGNFTKWYAVLSTEERLDRDGEPQHRERLPRR